MRPIPITRDLALTILMPHHTDELFRLTDENRAYLRQWLPWVDNAQCADNTRDYIVATQAQFERNEGFQAGIMLSDTLIGTIGYHTIDWANRSTSLGYWLAEKYQGKGLMTLACRTMVSHAFDLIHLNRVEIRAAVGNSRSQAIPVRLGFQQEGILREAEWLYDHFVDLIVYSMLQRDWSHTITTD